MVNPGISVLVLYENFAVGAAVLRRLLDVPMVHMVRAENASACEGSYDVVVMCPYLREHRRADVLRRWAGNGRDTSVIELQDIGGGEGVTLVAGPTRSDSADTVMSALRAVHSFA
jgi:hypothetical protein